jgi:hypothetical protein
MARLTCFTMCVQMITIFLLLFLMTLWRGESRFFWASFFVVTKEKFKTSNREFKSHSWLKVLYNFALSHLFAWLPCCLYLLGWINFVWKKSKLKKWLDRQPKKVWSIIRTNFCSTIFWNFECYITSVGLKYWKTGEKTQHFLVFGRFFF